MLRANVEIFYMLADVIFVLYEANTRITESDTREIRSLTMKNVRRREFQHFMPYEYLLHINH